MTGPEHVSSRLEMSDLHEDPTALDRNRALHVTDIINALHTDLPDGGWLSTLLWNTRNTYLSTPEATFSAQQMQMVVEGLLTEVANLKP